MTRDRKQRYEGYQGFYEARNPADARRQARAQRDYRRRFGPLLRGLEAQPILDIGCANGTLLAALHEAGFRKLTGIDISPQLIEQARAAAPGAELAAADAQQFLDKGRRFRVIFLLNLLEHLERDELPGFLAAVCQALTPEGFAVVRIPNMNTLLAAGHLADDFTHFTGFTEQSLEQLARQAGFARCRFLPQWPMQTAKGKLKTLLAWPLHKYLFWLRGGTRPRIFHRNLYAQLLK